MQGIRRQKTDGWLALAAAFVMIIFNFVPDFTALWNLPFFVNLGEVTISFDQLSSFLIRIVVSILLMRRFIRGVREKKQIESEMEQARQVQQVLIPEALPSIAGFEIHSEYHSALQVGGDFFQILPLAGNGVLVVIGDVSGKGIPAAMTVSLLVGAFRVEANITQQPGAILAAINEQMLGRSRNGFTTCLVVRIDADGSLTAANAGHLAPYIAGKEVEIESGLPLGLSADVRYPETRLAMSIGSQLTLITDGVAEARDAAGQLFGFERTEAISGQSAGQIALIAQQFGQEDDITVLTLTRGASAR